MSVDTYDACVEGYKDKLFDQQILAIQQGFWTGYYMGSKHPKSPDAIATSMIKDRDRDSSATTQPKATEVDVEAFLQREAEFHRRLMEGANNG